MDEMKTYEQWTEAKSPPRWLAAAARALRGWAVGKEVTEAEFDSAVQAAAGVKLGAETKEQ